ncbi:hypothetical protein OPIT5_14690 [Opitutaceae bacterium TAV5]|nr:hypothetical protein OPIT5_14690 [Opitutaceae bacterium TAV5]
MLRDDNPFPFTGSRHSASGPAATPVAAAGASLMQLPVCPDVPWPAVPKSRVHTAENGTRCVRLATDWPALLRAFNELSSVLLVVRTRTAGLARAGIRPDFRPCAGTWWMELSTGTEIDLSEWSLALAVDEPAPGGRVLGWQIFDENGHGLLKLHIAPRDTDLWHILLSDHASDGWSIAAPLVPDARPPAAWGHNLPARWDAADPAWSPSLATGATPAWRLSAARALGPERARPVSLAALARMLMTVTRGNAAPDCPPHSLDCVLEHGSTRRTRARFTPHVSRLGDRCLVLADTRHQLHLFLDPDPANPAPGHTAWLTRRPSAARDEFWLELFDAPGLARLALRFASSPAGLAWLENLVTRDSGTATPPAAADTNPPSA